jgi:hypothetical protein
MIPHYIGNICFKLLNIFYTVLFEYGLFRAKHIVTIVTIKNIAF